MSLTAFCRDINHCAQNFCTTWRIQDKMRTHSCEVLHNSRTSFTSTVIKYAVVNELQWIDAVYAPSRNCLNPQFPAEFFSSSAFGAFTRSWKSIDNLTIVLFRQFIVGKRQTKFNHISNLMQTPIHQGLHVIISISIGITTQTTDATKEWIRNFNPYCRKTVIINCDMKRQNINCVGISYTHYLEDVWRKGATVRREDSILTNLNAPCVTLYLNYCSRSTRDHARIAPFLSRVDIEEMILAIRDKVEIAHPLEVVCQTIKSIIMGIT